MLDVKPEPVLRRRGPHGARSRRRRFPCASTRRAPSARAVAGAGLAARRRARGRQPRQLRCAVPAARAAGRLHRRLGRLSARAGAQVSGRRRWTASPRCVGSGTCRRRSAAIPRASRSAATAPAAISPRCARSSPATRARPRSCFQLLVYPRTAPDEEFPSHHAFAEGYLLTRKTILWFHDHYRASDADREDFRYAPLICKDLSRLPPALIIVGECDPLRDDGIAYARSLEAAGNAVELADYPGMVHPFFSMGGAVDAGRKAVPQMAQALRRALTPEGGAAPGRARQRLDHQLLQRIGILDHRLLSLRRRAVERRGRVGLEPPSTAGSLHCASNATPTSSPATAPRRSTTAPAWR